MKDIDETPVSLQLVRFTTAPERVAEVEAAVRKLFAAVERAAPAGMGYAAARVSGRPEFLLTLRLPQGRPNPLLEIEEALAFRAGIARWTGAPVPPVALSMLGRYAG